MEIRKLSHRVGARAWVEPPAGDQAAPGWPRGKPATVFVLNEGGMVTLHDEAGEVFTLPHYEVNTGWEFHGHTGWIPESDPRVLDWLETQFKKVDAEKWPDPVARERAATLLFYRQLLVRNGRADPSNDPSQRQQTTDEPLAPYLPNEASPTASKNCA